MLSHCDAFTLWKGQSIIGKTIQYECDAEHESRNVSSTAIFDKSLQDNDDENAPPIIFKNTNQNIDSEYAKHLDHNEYECEVEPPSYFDFKETVSYYSDGIKDEINEADFSLEKHFNCSNQDFSGELSPKQTDVQSPNLSLEQAEDGLTPMFSFQDEEYPGVITFTSSFVRSGSSFLLTSPPRPTFCPYSSSDDESDYARSPPYFPTSPSYIPSPEYRPISPSYSPEYFSSNINPPESTSQEISPPSPIPGVGVDYFTTVPPEIFILICRTLSAKDLFNLCRACKRFNLFLCESSSTSTQHIWRIVREETFPISKNDVPPQGIDEREYMKKLMERRCKFCKHLHHSGYSTFLVEMSNTSH
ncbi:10891_t:CDS:2 [Acaulospora morrowiae]|uniref:10891_t:CDS:1 n=1 Tax=Acaulospora morrowiae TaxID=94023 RepID=A0A9N9BA21_9GLOM|nr:10891_t:CDS:2 [Acaulospora morrowiae]